MTTMGIHIHLTYGWEVVEDMPKHKFTLLKTPAGRPATVHGDDPVLSILVDGVWHEWSMPTTDNLRFAIEDLDGEP